MLDDILNRVPLRSAPYVGASAFAHKAGLHASAILKDPATYEHVDPALVGNERVIPMSNQAGQSNLRARLAAAGIEVDPKDPRLGRILEVVKEREDQGYAYDGAQASFELVARANWGCCPEFFEVKRYRVTVERRKNKYNRMVSLSEAVVVVKIGERRCCRSATAWTRRARTAGPVNALAKALGQGPGPLSGLHRRHEAGRFQGADHQGGTEAVTRVIIDSEDGQGRRWSTVGVSANIVDASFEALLDAIKWKLIRDFGPRSDERGLRGALVERGDPDRFRAVMAAPVEARAQLLPALCLQSGSGARALGHAGAADRRDAAAMVA
jgi:2-isopropylmalate synthase